MSLILKPVADLFALTKYALYSSSVRHGKKKRYRESFLSAATRTTWRRVQQFRDEIISLRQEPS
jgi:hypothetical protein